MDRLVVDPDARTLPDMELADDVGLADRKNPGEGAAGNFDRTGPALGSHRRSHGRCDEQGEPERSHGNSLKAIVPPETRRARAGCHAASPRADPCSSSNAASSSIAARRIGRPSTGLKGAWRMPSTGNTVASTVRSPALKRTAG